MKPRDTRKDDVRRDQWSHGNARHWQDVDDSNRPADDTSIAATARERRSWPNAEDREGRKGEEGEERERMEKGIIGPRT